MNKNLYRVVFNKARGLLMAVSEIATSHSNTSNTSGTLTKHSVSPSHIATLRPLSFSILLAIGAVGLVSGVADAAGIVADGSAPSNQQPIVLNAANGVPQVNIQTPSAAGVSRNTYTQFDVQQQGVILNNSRTDVQTQLGGYVQANPYLATGAARVILNEVNSNNPSLLQGYIEVAGSRAQVVIANPAGVTCDGCGFINANRATLTTGTPILNGGSLDGYRVQRGTVNITGNGLDASQTDYTDIIARAVQVNASIYANDLRVTAGSNQVNTANTTATPITGTGTTPTLAIDVAQLGGMYAGKIQLIGTEAGVGVSNAGKIGASAGDVVVSASGFIQAVTGTISSSGNTSITTGTDGFNNSGTVYAVGNLSSASTGDISNSGTMAALGNTSLTANGANSQISSNTNGILAAGLKSDGTFFGTGNLSLSATKAILANGKNLAIGNVTFTGSSLDLSNSQTNANNLTLTATEGNINASGASLTADGTLGVTANANHNQVLITDNASVSGNQFALAISNLSNVQGELVQFGTGDSTIAAQSVGNALGNIDNTGGRIATNSQNLTLSADTLTNTNGSIEHAGTSNLTINANTLTGDHGQILSNGDLKLTVIGSADLDHGNTTASQANITADSLSNVGGQIIQSGSNTSHIQTTQSIDNSQGTIASNGNLDIIAASIDNTSGKLQAAGIGNASINSTGNVINTLGQIGAAQDVTLTATTLVGEGQVLAGRDNTISLQGDYTNGANNALSANRNLNLSVTGTLTNLGSLQAVDNLQLSAASLVNENSLGAGADLTTYVNTLTNRGSIVGDHVVINATQNILNDGASALIGAISSLALNVGNQLDNTNGATIYSQGNLTIAADGVLDNTGRLIHPTNVINNISSLIEAEGTVNIATHQLNNIRSNVSTTAVTTLDQTVVMTPPSWRQILEGGTNYYSTVSANYGPQEIYYINPADILESSSYITPDGYVIGRVVINTHSNDSIFFVAGSGAYGGYGHRNRITESDGTQVLYYFSRDDNQSNPDQVAGTTGGIYASVESNLHFAGWGGSSIAFSTSYGTCTTNCVRLVTEPDYTDPLNHFARVTERALGPHIELYENQRNAHHVIKEDTLSANVGQEANIISGGDMRISYDNSLTNQYGQIMSGANLALDAATNADTINQGLTLYRNHTFDGQFRTIDGNWYNYTRPSISEVIGTVGGVISGTQQVSITGHTFTNIDSTAGTNPNILSGVHSLGDISNPGNGGNVNLLHGALYQTNPDPQSSYLYETDARFTNYRQWLSSDYLLQQLQFDPATAQKRVGDGFYEQKLVRDQVAQLTGRSFLQGYSSDEAQYQALMNNGVTVAKQYNLTPGVALSAAQVAALTSDIVWLTTQTVTLADGTTQQVLVPKVYLAQGSSTAITAGGALVTGSDVSINTNSIQNQGGQLIGSTRLALVANTDIINLGGTITGGSVNLLAGRNILNQTLTDTEQHQDGINTAHYVSISNQASISGNTLTMQAGQDISNLGATLKSTGAAQLIAGRDISLKSVVTDQETSMNTGRLSNSQSNIQQHGSQVDAGGNLSLSAGQDIQLVASKINGGADIDLSAGRDVSLISAANESKSTLYSDHHKTKSNQDVDITTQQGSEINSQGKLSISANHDVSLQASNLIAGQAIQVSAGNNINLTTANNETKEDYSSVSKKSGFLSKKTTSTQDSWDRVTAIGSTISGDSVSMVAGALPGNTGDINVTGSNIVATNNTSLNATGNINITAAQNLDSESHFKDVKKSGFMSSGGIGFTVGKQQLTNTGSSQSVTNSASTVGSINGDVNITSGKAYTQTGSDVLAPTGNVNITAQSVDINAAQNTSVSTQQTKFKQIGITLSISNPVISAVQTAEQMATAASKTNDPRMQALAAGTTALAAKNAYDAAQAGQAIKDGSSLDKLGGVTISVSLGTSKSQSDSTQTSSSAQGSNVTAGKDINITATGAGTASNLNVVGSTIQAADNVTLKADNQINLLAAQNSDTQTSTNKSSSASVGVSYNTSTGFAVTASASQGKGNANGTDVSYNNTKVIAGNQTGDKATLQSGTDTNLIGAEVQGNQVVANVGTSGQGNLNIQSLQDISTYNSKQNSAGIGVSIPVGGVGFGVSGNISNSKMTGDYASVNEQSGIKAGDGGFQITTNGNTNLTGAVIASSEQAIINNKNSLTTETLTVSDLQNRADYSASQTSLGGGYSTGNGTVGKDQPGNAQTGTQVPGTTLPSLNGFSATTPVTLSASGSNSSTTLSGISTGNINITDSSKQLEVTGKDAATTVATINQDVQVVNATDANGNTTATTVDSQGNNTAHSIAPLLTDAKKAEINADFAIVQAFTNETSTFIANRAKEADQKTQAAKTADQQANDLTNGLTDEQRLALRDQAISLRNEADAINNDWGAGGTYRQITTALIAAASGNVTGGNADFINNMVVNYVQQQGAAYIGKLVEDGTLTEGSPLHAALHAIVACGGAAASGQDCGAGAAGAAASSLLTGLFSDTTPDETNEQREAKRNLILSLVTGIAAATGTDAITANTAATAAVDNNWLATQQIVQMKKDYANASSALDKAIVLAKWATISGKQDVLTKVGIGKGLADAGWTDVKGLTQFLLHPVDGLNGIKQIITNENARHEITDEAFAALSTKIDRIQTALDKGGDANAEQLGEDLGSLLWQVGSVVGGAGGIAKAGTALAKVGVDVGTKTLVMLAENMPPLITGTLADSAKSFRFTGQQLPALTNLARNDGVLGEELASQLLKEASGKNFVSIQNGSGNGVDLVYIDTNTKTVYHVEVKTNQVNSTGGIPEGNLGVRFDNWITEAATSGTIAGKAISPDAQLLANKILPLLDNSSGYKISNNLMQVEIPVKGTTGTVSASLRPW